MGQDRLSWLDAANPLQGQVEMGMGWMGCHPQAIDDPQLDSVEDRKRGLVQGHDIRRIGHVADAVADGLFVAVALFEGLDGHVVDFKGPVEYMRPRGRFIEPGALENVGKAPFQVGHRRGRAIGVDFRATVPFDGPQFIDAVDMVGVAMGEQHGRHVGDPGPQQLRAEIRRGIDQDRRAAAFDQDRRPGPPISRFGRVAVAPSARSVGAADHRNAAGATATEDRYAHPITFYKGLETGGILLNKRKKFSVVMLPNWVGSMPLTAATRAAVWATKAGSLRFPRFGIGAK